jgi:ABC-type lipoprotein export system ATPase subunit
MKISVSHDFLPKQNSVRAAQVMDHFGIGFERGRHVIAEGLELPIESGQVVLFTGASGSGKSSLMRAVVQQLAGETDVVYLDDLTLPAALLIDALGLPAPEAMQLLSTCGLGEAHVMLRTPAELSDGQRYRCRLALALSQRPRWVVADEFTATLDRTLAKVIAFNLRRVADRTGVGFLLATTHEDVAEDLQPDVRVRCRLDGEVRVELGETQTQTRGQGEGGTRSTSRSGTPHGHPPLSPCPSVSLSRHHLPDPSSPAPRKKKARSPSTPSSGSPPPPVATGRTSLGGITAVTTSASPGS